MAAELRLHLSHLNKLLTCSLCHGLLKQATCLYCNHHFCMVCILDFTSRTGSCCPKCNLPATKQQAKYSPEFDKLVTIYQSLEIAAAGLQPCSPEMIREPDNAGSHKHNRLGQKKWKRLHKKRPAFPNESSPCPSHVESQHLADGSQNLGVCSSEQSGKKTAPYRGHQPMSKRVRPPCPLSRETTGHEENMPLLESKDSLTPDDTVKIRVDWSKGPPEKMQDISSELIDVKSSMQENSGVEMTKDHLCLPFKDAKGGLVIGNVVGVMAKLKEDSCNRDVHGDDTNVQHLKSQDLAIHPEISPNFMPKQKSFALDQVSCAFCQTPNDSLVAGPMLHYEKGVPVKAGKRIKSLISVHQHCAEWAPNVFYVGDVAKNLLKEVARGQKLKCSCCGTKGAVLGCLVKRCVKSFHYPCARTLSCRWDNENFLVLCPEHVGSKLPCDIVKKKAKNEEDELKSASGAQVPLESDEALVDEKLIPSRSQALHTEGCEATAEPKKAEGIASNKSFHGASCNWVLCGSGLKSKTYELLAFIAKHFGAKFTKTWDPCVTHLIIGTDERGAASRTLKFLLATLAGSWILRSEWLDACMAACQHVSEEQFEVNLDIHGMVGGPKHARLLAASRNQALFEGLDFYLMGDYAFAYKEDLQVLIKTAGGRLLTALEDGTKAGEVRSYKVVVYSADMVQHATKVHDCQEVIRSRWLEARSLACKVKALVVRHTWILDSIAAYELQPFG